MVGKKYLHFWKKIYHKLSIRHPLIRTFGKHIKADTRNTSKEEITMCTMIVEKVKIEGSGKGTSGWFKLEGANISYDHPFNAPYEHALNIDFVNESQGPSARVAVELSEVAARELVKTILTVLNKAEVGGHLESQR
jgi:hypothetical protein